MKHSASMVEWPAVIKYAGDDELLLVNSEADWFSEPELCQYQYGSEDFLFDSNGNAWRLDKREAGNVIPVRTSEAVQLKDFIILVRLHASARGECCIEKINFSSFTEGIRLVSTLPHA